MTESVKYFGNLHTLIDLLSCKFFKLHHCQTIACSQLMIPSTFTTSLHAIDISHHNSIERLCLLCVCFNQLLLIFTAQFSSSHDPSFYMQRQEREKNAVIFTAVQCSLTKSMRITWADTMALFLLAFFVQSPCN